jgi:uncharacterized protein DUF4261
MVELDMTEDRDAQSPEQPLVFVLLESAVEPDLQAIVAAIRARHPGVSVQLPGDAAQSHSTVIECNGELVAMMSVPAPVPRDDATIARASATWPQAAATIGSHRAHLIVSALGKDLDRLCAARIVTAVVGGMIAAVPGCVGVVWNVRVAYSSSLWLEMSRAAFAPYPDYPFMLWISIHPFRYGSTIVAVTFGLGSFVGREIEFEGKGLDLPSVINRVAGLAVYMIERGSVIPNGHTFGADERERLQIHHTASRRFSGLPVLLVSTAA